MPSSASHNPRYFGLDLGSNTFSAIIVEMREHAFEVIQDASYVVRLSEGLKAGKDLGARAMDRAIDTLEQISSDFSLASMTHKKAVATQVLRIAANAGEFVSRAEAAIGVPVEIISDKQEAMMTARGASVGLELQGDLLMIDIGGQSTEVVLRQNDHWSWSSLPVGVVGLFERFHDDPSAWRREFLAALPPWLPSNFSGTSVAVAGTATTLAMLERGITHWDRAQVHGTPIGRTQLEKWRDQMLRLRPEERTTKYNIEPGRADVFPVGLTFLEAFMDQLGCGSIIVSANGLRTGAAISLKEGNLWTWD